MLAIVAVVSVIVLGFTLRQRSVLTIYIGDDLTDEDAFRALADGINIRVGAHTGSKAHYYVQDTEEVMALLQ